VVAELGKQSQLAEFGGELLTTKNAYMIATRIRPTPRTGLGRTLPLSPRVPSTTIPRERAIIAS